MSCDVGHTRDLDISLLWLWCRPAAAALIQPLAWKLPYAADAALKTKKKEKKKKKANKTQPFKTPGEPCSVPALALGTVETQQ